MIILVLGLDRYSWFIWCFLYSSYRYICVKYFPDKNIFKSKKYFLHDRKIFQLVCHSLLQCSEVMKIQFPKKLNMISSFYRWWWWIMSRIYELCRMKFWINSNTVKMDCHNQDLESWWVIIDPLKLEHGWRWQIKENK